MNAREQGMSLHIERLVIEGAALSARDAAVLRRAVQRELARLLRGDQGGARLQGGAVASLSAPVVRFAGQLRPAELGRWISRSVHSALTGRRFKNP